MHSSLPVVFVLLAVNLPSGAHAETCEEDHESCMEGCHIDFGMDPKRVELTRCIQQCDHLLDNCADLRQEEKRSQVRLRDPEPAPRRGAPVDAVPYTEDKPLNVHAAKPEPFDEGDKPEKPDKPKTTKPDPETPKKADVDAPPPSNPKPKPVDDPPPRPRKPEKKDDDWEK